MNGRATWMGLAAAASAMIGCGGVAASAPSDAGASAEDAAPRDASAAPDASGALADAGLASADAAPAPGPAVVMFGGDGPAYMNDTWEWTTSDGWRARTLASPPPARGEHALASLNGKVVLFGGAGPAPLGDTWEYDGARWTKKDIPGPEPRARHAMATLGNRVVLYGGLGAAGELDDTWEYDGASWTKKNVTGPGVRESFAMATLGDKVVLYGGIGNGDLAATWEYDGTSWTKKSLTPSPASSSTTGLLFSPGMATLGAQVILFGGELDANHISDETWTYDGAAWTKVAQTSAPKARWHHGMAALGGEIVVFGGDPGAPGGGGFLDDTWVRVGGAWSPFGEGDGAPPTPGGRYAYTLAVRQ